MYLLVWERLSQKSRQIIYKPISKNVLIMLDGDMPGLLGSLEGMKTIRFERKSSNLITDQQ